MNEGMIAQLCAEVFSKEPRKVERCGVGTGNYVYVVDCAGEKYVFRCSKDNDYGETAGWLERLAALDIPVPKVAGRGSFSGYAYLILSYIEGRDIGLVYRELSDRQKREIAGQVVEIQEKAAKMETGAGPDWKWTDFIEEMLERAGGRIAANGWFDVEKADRLRGEMGRFSTYFAGIGPTAYLDDITTKNLLVHNGRLSGIIDIDWIGMGDRLTQPALTCMALLNMECDTDYARYILEGMRPSEIQKKAFVFYMLMYCVDFMGERGTQFMDKTVEVNQEIIDRLNGIYDRLWEELQR